MTFAVISDIDAMYYNTIKSSLKKQLEKRNFQLPIANTEQIDREIKGFSRFQLSWLSPIEFIYQTIYFHLFPLLMYKLIEIMYESGYSKV